MKKKIKEIKNNEELIGQTVTLCGWVRTVRDQKNFSFIEINDGSTLSNLQVIYEAISANYEMIIKELSTGTSVLITGVVVKSPAAKQKVEIKATHVEIVGKCDVESYPLQKKRHSLEFLRSIAHLRARTNTIGALARVSHVLSFATHAFFHKKGFYHVHTPIITASDCEGAGEQFQVTTLDSAHPPRNDRGEVDYGSDFFGKQAYLTVSGQLNGESYACALGNIYTFGPTFRAENSNTSRHLAEFWMIEPEMAFADIFDNMNLAEEYLKSVFKAVLEECSEEMEFFDAYIHKGVIDRLKSVVESPFERITYTQAIDILKNSKKSFQFACEWGCDLQSEHERYLCEEHFKRPVIVRDYPEKIKAFYMRRNSDNQTVAAMDVLVPDVGEIIGGSQREERMELLIEKMDAIGLDKKPYQWYLDLRKYGTVPHAGFGAGFERLLLFATGLENIRDAIPFPRFPGYAEF